MSVTEPTFDAVRPSSNHKKKKKKGKNGKDSKQLPAPPSVPNPLVDEWTAWQSHLATRPCPTLLDSDRASRHPFTWGLASEQRSETLDALIRFLCGKKKGNAILLDRMEEWVERVTATSSFDLDRAIESIAWCRALDPLAADCDAERWLAMFHTLYGLASDASAFGVEMSPLISQLVAGELGLTLARLFPEVPAAEALGAAGRVTVAAGMRDLLDGEGMLGGAHLEWARVLLACWTRCWLTVSGDPTLEFDDESVGHYRWFVRQNLRMCRDDGSSVFAPRGRDRDVLELATDLVGSAVDQSLLKRLRKKGAKDARSPKAKPPAVYSEWAELAVMRCDWSPKSPLAVVEFTGSDLRTELNANGETLWSGCCPIEVSADGRSIDFTGPWHETCWFTDRDVDYLELEKQTTSGWTLQRQTLLARQDGFYFQADVVLGPDRREIHFTSGLPLTSGLSFAEARDTREGWLVGDKHAALVMPLALPEWRQEQSPGELTVEGDSVLSLRMKVEAAGLYAPLLVDLKRSRFTRPYTWRRLTVAEDREIVGPDVAAGYRVQVGKQQWLIYRALRRRKNRTLLGQNLALDFLAARFKRDGAVKELIEIE